jgi:hypothetical protein
MKCKVVDGATRCLDQQCDEDYILNPKDGQCIRELLFTLPSHCSTCVLAECNTGCKTCTYDVLSGDKNVLSVHPVTKWMTTAIAYVSTKSLAFQTIMKVFLLQIAETSAWFVKMENANNVRPAMHWLQTHANVRMKRVYS